MRLGIGSYTYGWAVGVPGSEPETPLTPDGLIQRAARLGVRVVQVCDNLPLDKLGEVALASLANQAQREQVCIEVGTRGIAPQHLRTHLQLARRLGSPILRTVIDAAQHRPATHEVVRLLSEVLPEFEQSGVTLALENHDRFTARELADIIMALGSQQVGICLDTVNSFGAREGPEVVADTLAPFTVNLHVKDFTVRRVDHQMGFVVEGRPAGQGRLDVPWLLRKLSAAGRDPNAILELWTPPEEALGDTIAKERRWAEESVTYLRTLIPE